MVSQCGQALERSGIYAEEQRSRLRAERLQGMTALLSNALTPADVARVVVDEVSDAVEATTVVLATVGDGRVTGILMQSGAGEDETSAVSELLEVGSTATVRVSVPFGLAGRSCSNRTTGSLTSSRGAGTDGAGRSADAPRRPARRRPAHERAAGRVRGSKSDGLHRTSERSSRRWRARPRRRSTAPVTSRRSRRSPRPSSGVSCPFRFRVSTASSSPLGTCREVPSSTSAATGSTRCGSPTAGSASWSATSSGRAFRRPRAWRSSETRSVHSRSSA